MKVNKKINMWLIGTVVVITCRIISIWHMPKLFSDEIEILEHIQSIISTGYDMNGNFLPLFPKVGTGLATYTYLYPMVAMLSAIGVTAIRARFVQQILTIMACFLTSIGIKIWTKDKKMFWSTLLICLTIPWGFVQANRIWDPSFVPFYFSIYFFFFSLLMKGEKITKLQKNIYLLGTVVSLVLLATVYPPARIPAVAMWMYSVVWATKEKRIGMCEIVGASFVSAIIAMPLAINLLNPEFNQRATELFVFNQPDMTRYQQVHLFFKSFAELFNPNFLFVSGDIIYRHSLPIFGMLGTISIIPLWEVLRKNRYSSLIFYMFFVIVMTYVSTALTYDYQPHGLRSCLAWIPYSIIIANGWISFMEGKSNKQYALWGGIIIVQFVLYFTMYIVLHNNIITLRV